MLNYSSGSFKVSVVTNSVNHWQALNFSQLILSENTNTTENLTLLYTLNISGWLAVLKATVY
jgi:hypothetical protein